MVMVTYNGFGDKAAEVLGPAIGKSHTMVMVTYNGFGDKAAEVLGPAI